ncbi:MAG: DUF1501 domain-containing protein [Gemmataceae bacterium]
MPHASALSRRDLLLRAGTLALGGLSFPDLLAARPASAPDTAVILFWMWGGPSHFETFDPKPEAPEGIRGPFRPIRTAVPGMQICELFPRIAQQAQRMTLVRSLHHALPNHNDGSIEVLTGKTPAKPDPTSTNFSEHPDFGMIASELRRRPGSPMPGYVGVPRVPFMVRPNYLGVSARGFDAGDPSAVPYAPANLSLAGDLAPSRVATRRSLKQRFDQMRGQLDRADTLHGRAFDLLTSPQVARAFDLSREDPRVRERYGRHLWGQSCLLARRLVEAGTVVVTVDALAPKSSGDRYFSWDDHINATTRWDLADAMRYRAPYMDQAVSALIDDLYTRGLDRKVMVVCVGEFGRTPRVVRDSGTGVTGRDHWPQAYCALVSGGGIRGGQLIGATNVRGEYPRERPLTPQDLLATLYQHLGVDARHIFSDAIGRPIPVLSEGTPIRELLPTRA